LTPHHRHPAIDIQRRPHRRQHEHRPGSPAAFRWSILLNAALSGLQLAIGTAFGSLALIGDAIHNLGEWWVCCWDGARSV
jgi:cobalt-zinc-cadmium efflux system protein